MGMLNNTTKQLLDDKGNNLAAVHINIFNCAFTKLEAVYDKVVEQSIY